MESAGVRLPRWFAAAGQILDEQREVEDEEEDATVGRRLRDRTASLVGAHPVLVASFLGVLVGAVAVRSFLGPEALHGGALPAFPSSWNGFFYELTSGYRTTGLGGTLAASPALGAMGALSWIAFGSTTVAQKVLLAGGPLFASIMLYRALAGSPAARRGGGRAASYGLSATVLWAFPKVASRCWWRCACSPSSSNGSRSRSGQGSSPTDGRFIAGLAVTFAVGMAFMPGVALAAAVIVVVQILFGSSRLRGLGIAAAAFAAAAALLFPFVPTMLAGDAVAFGSHIGTTDLGGSAGSRSVEDRGPGWLPRSCRSRPCWRSRWWAPSIAGSRTERSSR